MDREERESQGARPAGAESIQRNQQPSRRRSTIDDFGVGMMMDEPSRARLDSAVQRIRSAAEQREAGVHEAAARGTRGGGGPLPHLDQVQASFGRHDVSGVTAHVGGAARVASEAMGAEAFATGNDVAFKRAQDLHTAAHEAAHVVQQRSGVSLKGGVGEVGDAYERQADAVADLVVRGESAERALGSPGPRPAGGGSGSAVQHTKKSVEYDGRNFHLLGTHHGYFGQDESSYITDNPDRAQNASLIVEHPSLVESGQAGYKEEQIAKVSDKTQTALMKQLAAKGVRVDGGDGRKAILGGEYNALTLRHKQEGDYEQVQVQEKQLEAIRGSLVKSAQVYIAGALRLSQDGPEAFMEAVDACVKYKDGTNPNAILVRTFKETSGLASELDEGQRQVIATHTLGKMGSDLQSNEAEHKEQVELFKKWAAEPANQGSMHALTGLGDMQKGHADTLMGSVYDAICNLLLFTKVLACKSENVIVAFGEDHVKVLDALLDDVKKLRSSGGSPSGGPSSPPKKGSPTDRDSSQDGEGVERE